MCQGLAAEDAPGKVAPSLPASEPEIAVTMMYSSHTELRQQKARHCSIDQRNIS